jgi:hypothetical protein
MEAVSADGICNPSTTNDPSSSTCRVLSEGSGKRPDKKDRGGNAPGRSCCLLAPGPIPPASRGEPSDTVKCKCLAERRRHSLENGCIECSRALRPFLSLRCSSDVRSRAEEVGTGYRTPHLRVDHCAAPLIGGRLPWTCSERQTQRKPTIQSCTYSSRNRGVPRKYRAFGTWIT